MTPCRVSGTGISRFRDPLRHLLRRHRLTLVFCVLVVGFLALLTVGVVSDDTGVILFNGRTL